jgi:hypothetical protein
VRQDRQIKGTGKDCEKRRKGDKGMRKIKKTKKGVRDEDTNGTNTR